MNDSLFSNVKILDCTLRDGGHLNKWNFSKDFARRVYSAVSESELYCMEVGYVTKEGVFPEGTGIWRFSSEEDIRSIVSPGHHTKIAVMGDVGKVELDNFKDKEESIVDLVRLAFYPGHITEAIELGEQVMDKGYDVSLNLMAITRYSKQEVEDLISLLYSSKIENIFVSDSFGSLLPNQVADLINVFKIGTGKAIGYHPHNNLELAFANAIRAVEAGATYIDSTIYGMGRGAGNLPLEVVLSYINHHENGYVNMIPLLELIEDEFIKLRENLKWGYNLEYVLSGILKCHPNYASKLIKDNRSMKEIWPILTEIGKQNPVAFDQKTLDEAISKSGSRALESPGSKTVDFSLITTKHVKLELPKYINRHKGRDFLVLAQGPSLKKNIEGIKKFAKEKNLIILGANYLGGLIEPNYHAFCDFKRFSSYINHIHPSSKLLLGSYFSEEVIKKYTNLDFELIPYVDNPTSKFDISNGVIQTNAGTVSILLIAVAIVMGARKIYVAGLDGYKKIDGNATHFYDEKHKVPVNKELNSLHNICENYLDQIKQYQLNHNLEPFEIITPTSYSRHYNQNYNFR